MDNEELLLKIVDDDGRDSVMGGERSNISDKTTFRFENNQLLFSKHVNAEKSDVEINHAIPESQLDELITQSWTETLFYGVGNKNM